MKEKNLPQDYEHSSLDELTKKANEIIKALENENDLNNVFETYQDLIRLNKIIEKKFQKNFKYLNEKTNDKIKKLIKRK